MRTEEQMIAYALEIEPQLLPYVPTLLADLEELGSNAGQIVEVVREFQLPDTTRVIDLGCGKGVVSVEIADELGFHVLGIELFEPFIQSCIQCAREAHVSDVCMFRHGDILKMVDQVEPADVAVFAALGDVLGRLDETIDVIRKFVKPGGLILVSDAFVTDGGSTSFAGFENYAMHDETVRRLTKWGDVLEREVLASPDESDEDDEESAMIQKRALNAYS